LINIHGQERTCSWVACAVCWCHYFTFPNDYFRGLNQKLLITPIEIRGGMSAFFRLFLCRHEDSWTLIFKRTIDGFNFICAAFEFEWPVSWLHLQQLRIPRPCSPALAASSAALAQGKLVCSAIFLITSKYWADGFWNFLLSRLALLRTSQYRLIKTWKWLYVMYLQLNTFALSVGCDVSAFLLHVSVATFAIFWWRIHFMPLRWS